MSLGGSCHHSLCFLHCSVLKKHPSWDHLNSFHSLEESLTSLSLNPFICTRLAGECREVTDLMCSALSLAESLNKPLLVSLHCYHYCYKGGRGLGEGGCGSDTILLSQACPVGLRGFGCKQLGLHPEQQ